MTDPVNREEKQGIDKSEVLLTPAQVAKRYGLSLQWAYHCKELQPIKRKIGKYVFYRLSDLEAVEVMDRDKPTGAKTVPLDLFRKYEEEKRLEKARKNLKFDIADDKETA